MSTLVQASISPNVDRLHDEPKAMVVSSYIDSNIQLFAAEQGVLLSNSIDTKNSPWTSIQLEGAGLLTSIVAFPDRGQELHDLSSARDTLHISLIVTSAKGNIYRSSLSTMESSWNQVYFANVDDPVALFDVASLDERRVLASGAFGMLLESVSSGETWRAIGDRLDNPDAGHLYRILTTSSSQVSKFGVDAVVLGEFGQFFLLSDQDTPTPQWQRFAVESEVTFFDGGFLSDRWLLMFGVGGVVAAFDFETQNVIESSLCQPISVFSVAADSTGRNLLLAGDQGVLIRLSLLDEGEASPPPLTCQSRITHEGAIHNLSVQGQHIFMAGDNGVQEISVVECMKDFSAPQDLRWSME